MGIKKGRSKYRLFLLPLLCLMLFAGALAVTEVTYSKHLSGASDDDSVSVAEFDVEIVFGDVKSVEDKEKAEVPITITNNSEVTVSYDVVLKLPNKLPSNTQSGNSVVCSVNGKGGTVSNDGKTVTITDAGRVEMGKTVATNLIITSQVPGASGISDLNRLTYTGATVIVQVNQVD